MNKVITAIKNFIQDEEGVTAIEYSLIAALIAVVIIGAVTLVGEQVDLTFQTVGDTLSTANGGGAAPAPAP